MNININETEYNTHFGIGFVRALDQKYFTKGVGGAQFGTGLEVLIAKMKTGDVAALQEIIFTGIEGKKPSQKEMDEYIDQAEDIDALMEEVIDELKKSNAARKRTLNAIESVEGTEGKKS